MILFHGSEKLIRQPKFKVGNPHNDYGYGFYCTNELEAAKEWANRYTENGIVNKYSLDLRYLKVLDLTKESVLTWIAILLKYRKLSEIQKHEYELGLRFLKQYEIDISEYDVIIGYRADDAYFTFPLMFLNNELTLETLEKVYMLGNLGIQYAAISEKAISKMKFINYVEVEREYRSRYLERVNSAKNRFEELANNDRYSNGTRLRDLINKHD